MFTFRLLNPDGTAADPATFTSSEPGWHVGDLVLIRPGVQYRIVSMEAAADANGVWTVEPVPTRH